MKSNGPQKSCILVQLKISNTLISRLYILAQQCFLRSFQPINKYWHYKRTQRLFLIKIFIFIFTLQMFIAIQAQLNCENRPLTPRKSFTIIHATIPWLVEAMLALLVPQKVGVPSRLVFTFVTHKLLLFVLGVLVGIQMVVGFVFLFT